MWYAFRIQLNGREVCLLELLQKARNGDETALKELFLKYHPLVSSMQQKYYIRGFESDDWFQEAMIVFYQCLLQYDEATGVTIGALFKRSFENRVRTLIRHQCAYKRKGDHSAVSLDEKIDYEGPDCLSDSFKQTKHLVDSLHLQEALRTSKNDFSKMERAVMIEYLRGKELEQIAQENDLGIKQIRGAYDRGKKKIIACFKESE